MKLKRALALLLSFTMIFSLGACGAPIRPAKTPHVVA